MLRLRGLGLSLWEVLTLAAMTGVLISLLINGNDFDETHRYPRAKPNADAGFRAIAGDYHERWGRGSRRLSILADGRYSLIELGCTGVGLRESGWVARDQKRITLVPIRRSQEPVARTFLPVTWASRNYLVRADRLREFCTAILHGDEPRKGAGGDYSQGSQAMPTGAPELPEPWAKYLRDEIILGSIVAVTNDGLMTIDAGASEGLRIGGSFAVQSSARDTTPIRLQVTAVSDHACQAIVETPDASHKQLAPGMKVVASRGYPPPSEISD